MKTRLISVLGLLILLSCSDGSDETVLTVYKEIYYRLDTGEKQAEKIITHDSRGNLINEQYYDLKFSQAGYEIQNTFNAQNQKTLHKYIFTDQNMTNTISYSYQNGKLKTETLFVTGSESRRNDYFYSTFAGPDSIRVYIMNSTHGYVYDLTTYFSYDAEGRLIEERWSGGLFDNVIIKRNTYADNLLMETCNPLTHMPEGKNCIKNEYTAGGKISKIYSTLTGEADVLLEEYFYEGNLLASRKVFNQRDAFPAYNADPTIYTTLVRYEYPE